MASAQAKTRWGILSVGNIAQDFCTGLIGNDSVIQAVAARDLARAESFAKKYGVKKAYGSYEEVIADPEVDIVYIGTVPTVHLEHTKMALEAGKHVLCEKPLGINAKQVKEMVELAKSKGLFFMEGMWTRFFPAMKKVREVLASGELGTPLLVQAEFGFNAPNQDDPTYRLWDATQAGGAMLEIGCYVIAQVMSVFTGMPSQIACNGTLRGGVDACGALALTWEGQGSATLMCTIICDTPEEVVIICTNGSIRIHSSAHVPHKVTVSKTIRRGEFQAETLEFPHPPIPEGHSVNFPASQCFIYQIQGVEQALKEGKTQCEEFTHDESLILAKVMDTYRQQLGVVYPDD